MQTKVYINNIEIDISESQLDAVALSYAITDATNITARKSSSSKVIKAPGTRRNRMTFGFPEDVNSESALNQNQIITGKIEIDGITIINGVVRFIKPVTVNSQTEYQFIIIGQNSWKEALTENQMSDLDFPTQSHRRSPEMIEWNHNHVQENIFMYCVPLPKNAFVSYSHQYHLALNKRRIFLEIFRQAGYRVKSDFIDSDYFAKKYYFPKVNERDPEVAELREFKAANQTAITHNPAATTYPTIIIEQDLYIPFNYTALTRVDPDGRVIDTGLYDKSNLYDTSTGIFTPDIDGSYTFGFEIQIDSINNLVPEVLNCSLVVDGEILLREELIFGEKARLDFFVEHEFQPVFIPAGSQVSLNLTYFFDREAAAPETPSSIDFTIPEFGAKFYADAYLRVAEYEPVNIQEKYFQDVSQITFIKDCAVLYNLQFLTDESTKTVYIEPEGNFYFNTIKDITHKLDISQPIEVDELGSSYAKSIHFKYSGEENGATITNKNRFVNKEEDIPLSFFTKTPLIPSSVPYSGQNVPAESTDNGFQFTENNQLFHFEQIDSPFAIDMYTMYLKHIDLKFGKIPVIRFNDSTFNMDFADGELPGLLSTFYTDFRRNISTSKLITAYILWDVTDVHFFENIDESLQNDYRAKFFIDDYGPLRIGEISDFTPSVARSCKTTFIKDYSRTPFLVSPHSQNSLIQPEAGEMIISYVKMDVADVLNFVNPSQFDVDVFFEITVEHLNNTWHYSRIDIPNYPATANLPGGYDYNNPSVPQGFENLIVFRSGNFITYEKTKTVGAYGGPPLLNTTQQIANQSLDSVDHSGHEIKFFEDGYKNVWISEYGYMQRLEANTNFVLRAVAKAIVNGINYAANHYFELIINGTTYTGATSTINLAQEITTDFTLNLPSGIYPYTFNLYVNEGAWAVMDTINGKLYVHD